MRDMVILQPGLTDKLLMLERGAIKSMFVIPATTLKGVGVDYKLS
jgi:hypothetical protein